MELSLWGEGCGVSRSVYLSRYKEGKDKLVMFGEQVSE